MVNRGEGAKRATRGGRGGAPELRDGRPDRRPSDRDYTSLTHCNVI